MPMIKPAVFTAMLASALLMGCQASGPDASAGASADQVRRHVNLPLDWVDLPGDVLSRREAVAIGLRRHPRMAADLALISKSRADLAQAGLLPNPELAGSIGLDLDGGASKLAASLMQTLSALRQRPARQAVAEAQLQQTILSVSQRALDLAVELERRHRRVVHHQQRIEWMGQKRDWLDRMAQAAADRHEIGLGDAMQVSRVHGERLHFDLERQQAEEELSLAKRRLLEAMGLAHESPNWTAAAEPFEPLDEMDEREAVARGLASRLDVQAARWEARAAEREVELTRYAARPQIEAGLEFERDGGRSTLGPAASIELPVFDQGHARLAAAAARRLWHDGIYDATVNQAVAEIRQAWITLVGRRRQMELQQAALTHAERTLAQVQYAFDAGHVDRLEVLRAESDMLAARLTLMELDLQRDLAVIDYRSATAVPSLW